MVSGIVSAHIGCEEDDVLFLDVAEITHTATKQRKTPGALYAGEVAQGGIILFPLRADLLRSALCKETMVNT